MSRALHLKIYSLNQNRTKEPGKEILFLKYIIVWELNLNGS